MSNFNIEQSEVELESTFTPRLWTLVHDVPVLYEALLDKLGHVGLSTSDLRSDVGHGSVGNASVTLWLPTSSEPRSGPPRSAILGWNAPFARTGINV